MKTPSGSIKLLTPTDSVKDRLASFFYWSDNQALEQALLVAKSHSIDVVNLKRWAKVEGFSDKLNEFLKILSRKS